MIDVTVCFPFGRHPKLPNLFQACLQNNLSVRTCIITDVAFIVPPSGFSAHPTFGHAGRKTVTFDQVLAHTDGLQNLKPVPSELPETPFRPPAMPSEAPLSALPHSTPGLPANTPMAVQVLAGLLGLSTNALASQVRISLVKTAYKYLHLVQMFCC